MDVSTADAGLLQSKYRLTRQRAAVLRALDKGGHLSAETILERVRHELPGTSLGTVYRTLDILRELGLVQMFSYDGSAARYECSLGKHLHLTCLDCKRIDNVYDDEITAMALEIARRSGYSETDYALTIAGRCSACGPRKTDSGRRAKPGGNSE